MPSPHGLGKGLDALIPDTEERTEVAISQIASHSDQPRQTFPEQALMELAYSIKLHGVLQPLVVSRAAGRYELIAGERRLRAAKLAGLTHVPVFIRSADQQQRYELALIENLQRTDLSPLEEARAYQKLLSQFNLTQQELSKRLGKSRSKIAAALRLLKLPPALATALERGQISAGHASALLGHDARDQQRLLELIRIRHWSVRQAEAWSGRPRHKATQPDRPAWLSDLERTLGTKVRRRGSDRRGSLVISYHSAAELAQLIERLRY